MPPQSPSPQTIDAYIACCPAELQPTLAQLHQAIRKVAPKAAETIKYTMPTYTLNGNLVSFGLYKKHIGMYPLPAGDAAFQKAIAVYKSAKSTAQFPLDKPLPLTLIRKLVKFRVLENTAKAAAKAAKAKKK